MIDKPDWYPVGGGESGYIAPDPRDPYIVYAGAYEGEIDRYDKHTEQVQIDFAVAGGVGRAKAPQA